MAELFSTMYKIAVQDCCTKFLNTLLLLDRLLDDTYLYFVEKL